MLNVIYEKRSPTAAGIFSTVEAAEITVNLHVDPKKDSTFQHAKEGGFDAYWNPTIRLDLGAKRFQSPAVALAHELGHAKQCVEKLDWYEANSNGADYLKIEDDNVKTHETPVAEDLGSNTRKEYRELVGTAPFVGRSFKGKSLKELVLMQ